MYLSFALVAFTFKKGGEEGRGRRRGIWQVVSCYHNQFLWLQDHTYCLSSFFTIFACPFSSNEQSSHKFNFRETQHRLWLEREAIAQERFRKKTEDEARKLREKQEQEVGLLIYNYPQKGRWIVVDIYWDAKRQGIHPPLFYDPEGDSWFSIYQIRWIKKFFNFFFWNFREMTRHFSLRSQIGEYPRIFQVTGANQNARKLLSTDLVNTNK